MSPIHFRAAAPALLALALANALMPAHAGEPAPTGDRYLVRFRADALAATQAAARNDRFEHFARNAGASLRHHRELATGAWLVTLDRTLGAEAARGFLATLRAHADVAHAEADQRVQPFYVPNDPRAPQQWGFSDADAGIRARHAWDLATGAGTVVAVIDTGITAHPDLDANVLPGYDFIDDPWVANDGNGRDGNAADPGDAVATEACGFMSPRRDSTWHGTHVAGTVAAVTNNVRGVAGTAFRARLMPLRVLGKCGGYSSDVMDAIAWAAGAGVPGVPANPHPAEVANLSLGHLGACSPEMQAAIDLATAMGTVVVAAAGNDGGDVAQATPANCDGVIAVAATTATGERAWFSNHGSGITLAAPGEDIVSTLNTGLEVPETPGYGSRSGTSMAAPHVAAIAALVQSVSAVPRAPSRWRRPNRSAPASSTRARPSTRR